MHAETLTEAAQFKTLMSATGCGLLLFTLFGVVALLVGGAALDPRDGLQRASEAAGLVLTSDDFVESRSEFKDEARLRMEKAAPRLHYTTAPILIEQTEPSSSPLNTAREDRVRSLLAERGVANAGSRVEVRALSGKWFARAMTLAWIVMFLPLGVFLVAQGLVVLARGQRTEEGGAKLAERHSRGAE